MSDNNDSMYLIDGSTLTDIANAIREKTGKTNKIYPSNMDEEILSISTGYQPITVNITQSEHQTITATATASSSQLPVVNGQISTPTAITVYASIDADIGYTPGTLNQTSVVANWGDTVTFSATPATEIDMIEPTITFTSDYSSGVLTSDNQITFEFTAEASGGNVESTSYNLLVHGGIEYTFDVTDLQDGEYYTDSFVYTISESDILACGGDNIVFELVDSSNNTIETIEAEIEAPNSEATIEIETDASGTLHVGDTLNIIYTVTNTGNLTLTQGILENELTNFEYNGIILSPGDSMYSYDRYGFDQYTVTENNLLAGEISIVPTFSATSPDPDNPNYTTSETLTIDNIESPNGD